MIFTLQIMTPIHLLAKGILLETITLRSEPQTDDNGLKTLVLYNPLVRTPTA